MSINNFSGEVPKSIVNLNYLISVDFSNNRLKGPVFFCNQSLLIQIDLSNNSFSGIFPFTNISSQLEVVNLSSNLFSSTIPDIFRFLPFLESLQLGRNKFHGFIPPSLKYCEQLGVLDLSENSLSGIIPPWIGGRLSSLKILSLGSNNFTGQIPKELSYLTFLQILDLSQNYISGDFSLRFDNFEVMTKTKDISVDDLFSFTKTFYMQNIWLYKQGSVRQYTTALTDTTVIDISSNELSGEISNGITKLAGLKFLNMSRNGFFGNIPKYIGALEDLEALDLSWNKISGAIPSTMEGMTSLSFLNLSHNKLSGTIPTENQFGSFLDPSIYSGNSNLCGWPLRKCLQSNTNNNDDDNVLDEEVEYWYEKAWINAATAIGFLLSFWVIFIALLLNQSLRRLHFYYVDILYEWVWLQLYFGIAMLKTKT